MTGEPLDQVYVDALEAFIAKHGFLSWLDLTVEEITTGRVVLSIPYDGKLVNPAPGSTGSIHGGVAATLVDTAGGFALRAAMDHPTEHRMFTTDLSVSYLRPATSDLTVEAECVRAGTSMGVANVTVTAVAPDGEETEVAVGRTSYRIFRD